jgi:hypothetical protein
MSRAAILLGCGHPAGDVSGGTVLDVHLHPDCPEGPLSLGERWGRAPGVGAQFTLQEAVEREADHLRACGCAWLLPLAQEERLRGRRYSPEEILANQPRPTPVAVESCQPVPAARAAEDTPPKIRAAIAAADYEALESLRDLLTDEIVAQLAQDWQAALPWKTKDAYAALLQDQTAECVRPIFRDALNSPTVETRAYALCVLTGNFAAFTALLTDGWVDAAKVDAAIAAAEVA